MRLRLNVVTIDPVEIAVATVCGTERHRRAQKAGARDRSHVATHDGLNIHIQGAAAEIAASKHLNRRWLFSAYKPGQADLEPDIEVRSTPRPHGCLVIRQRDHDDRPYVLVVGQIPSFRVVGWVYGHEAKRYERRPDGSYWVPQTELPPL
jgi:hypothetical protein